MSLLRKHRKYIAVLGVFIVGLATSFIVEAGTESHFSHKLFLQILSLEFPEILLIDWDKGEHILMFSHNNETITMSLYGPVEYDNRWETGSKSDDNDLLGIYTITEDGLPRRIFRQQFPPQDTGQFEDIHVEDVTGDGKPEITVRHRSAYAGARSWGWQDHLYIINGRHPFETIFELKILDVAENIDGGERSMKVEVTIKDVDDDGINEMLLEHYEGKDESTMKNVTSRPLLYRFHNGRYVPEND